MSNLALNSQHITKTRECKFQTKGCKSPCVAADGVQGFESLDMVLSGIS